MYVLDERIDRRPWMGPERIQSWDPWSGPGANQSGKQSSAGLLPDATSSPRRARTLQASMSLVESPGSSRGALLGVLFALVVVCEGAATAAPAPQYVFPSFQQASVEPALLDEYDVPTSLSIGTRVKDKTDVSVSLINVCILKACVSGVCGLPLPPVSVSQYAL